MFGPGRRWRAALVLVALAGATIAVPMGSPAGAAEVRTITDCEPSEGNPLQEALDASVTGDTIVIADDECRNPDGVDFDMPEMQSITIEGADLDPGPAVVRPVMNGSENQNSRILRGNNVKSSVIRNLRFIQGSYSSNGAAIKIQRDSAVTIENNVFEDNSSGSGGGAISMALNPNDGTTTIRNNTFEGNVARTGGAIFLDTPNPVVLSGNRFVGNEASQYGGGVFVQPASDTTVVIENNQFLGNAVHRNTCVGAEPGGGGLAIDGTPAFFASDFQAQAVEPEPDGKPDVQQRGNLFGENVVDAEGCEQSELSAQAVYDGTLYGGGEYIINADVFSVNDQFLGNGVINTDGESTGDAEGGGIAMVAFASDELTFDAHNLVLAGNEAQGEGEGGGAYFGDEGQISVTMVNATIVNNKAVLEGGALSGSDSDSLTLHNSIVYGNTSQDDGDEVELSDFDAMTINFSDVCNTEVLTPESGNNICADPMLVNAAGGDVHQTNASPTLDAGSNALVPSTLTTDYEGQSRIADAKGDGPTPAVVDMGADETQAPPPVEPPPAVAGENQTAPGSIGEDDGYCLGAEDGGVFTFGGCQFFGAAGGREGRVRAAAEGIITAPQSLKKLNAPVVGIAMQPSDTGYWQAAADGGVFSFGTAGFHGSMGATPLTKPIVGIATSPTGNGYWLVASDGGVFGFGDAPFLGSLGNLVLAKPIVGITATPSGNGYWLVASDGGVFSFGDAKFFGSAAGMKLNAPIVGMGSRPGGLGYWLASSDGGVFTFGDAPFLGSRVGLPLNQPVIGIKSAASGNGYWLIAGDGGVFSFGSAPFLGSMGLTKLNQPVIDMTG